MIYHFKYNTKEERLKIKEYAIYMRIKPIQLKSNNRLINDYRQQNDSIINYFDYRPFDDFEKRVSDLKKRSIDRQALSTILYEMNEDWDAPEQSLQQIERLTDENSVVVIGGQQAGLLTGPMYTVNKIISIIKLAKEQENKLNIPVIPVFWIAGEDHDYDEINHMFSIKQNKLYKLTTKQQLYLKKSISHIEIDKEKTLSWLKQAFYDLQETTYTKDLFDTITICLNESNSYVDFFARLIYTLFPEEGIVLIDSAHPAIRQFERDFFIQFIENQAEISGAVYETTQVLQQKGYTIPLEVDEDDAHLFFHDENNERILLKRLENIWVGKNSELDLTTEQLLDVAKSNPERLSNNVITRPIMQELLFPTLAFVGGDGEISYWAALKKAFHVMGLNMPPVIPRLSFTFITSRIEKLLDTRVMDAEKVINHGMEDEKVNWLMNQHTPPVEYLFTEVKESMSHIHLPLRQLAKKISPDLSEEAEKNLQYILKHITYLESRTTRKLNEKYERQMDQFTEINNALKPNDLLQERVWNPLLFINDYGTEFIHELINMEPLSFEHYHYVIHIGTQG